MSRRPRGRGRKPQHNNNKGNNPNRALDSNGPDVRVRGSAKTIYDKYMSLAHDANVSGRRVKAESYLQHAEHYLRIVQDLAIVADKKAEQQRLATEQREAEQAARRAKHAAQSEKTAEKSSEKNAEKNTEKKSDTDDAAQNTKAEKSNGAVEEESSEKPKRRARSHLTRRRETSSDTGSDEGETAKAKDDTKSDTPEEAPAAE